MEQYELNQIASLCCGATDHHTDAFFISGCLQKKFDQDSEAAGVISNLNILKVEIKNHTYYYYGTKVCKLHLMRGLRTNLVDEYKLCLH